MRLFDTTSVFRRICIRLFLSLLGIAAYACIFVGEVGSVRAQVDHNRPHGEPFQLMGKRLVFTNWAFVYPGRNDWVDKEGKSVFQEKARIGPFEANFKMFDGPSGIYLSAEQAQRLGPPILTRDRPWEAMGVAILTLLQENGKYRAWGFAQDAEGKMRNCYFESRDGKAWERPNLGLVDYRGSRNNNLIEYGPGEFWAGGLFVDPSAPPEQRYKTVSALEPELEVDPNVPPDQRYKSLRSRKPENAKSSEKAIQLYSDYMRRLPWSKSELTVAVVALVGAVSPDGLHWTKLPEPQHLANMDTGGTVYYDVRLKKYVMYTRSYMIGLRADGYPMQDNRRHVFGLRRAIGRSETTDFSKFPLFEPVIEPGNDMSPNDSYYTQSYTTIPGAPDQHLMFPSIWRQGTDTHSVDLYTSYNGKVWSRMPGSPVLKTADFGKWDGGTIFASANLVELPDGNWALPYVGYNYPHKYPRGTYEYDVGLAVWPKGRLVALHAPEEGHFTTYAILSPGKQMRINAVTERVGSILVEVAGLDGKPLPGRSFDDAVPIVGEQYRTLVTWKRGDNLGIAAGQPVMLRFRMDKAKLYGLDFE